MSSQGYITTTSSFPASFQGWDEQQDSQSFASASPARSRGRGRQRSSSSVGSSVRTHSADSRRSYYRTGISLRQQQQQQGPASDFTPATRTPPRYASDLPKVSGILQDESQQSDFDLMMQQNQRQQQDQDSQHSIRFSPSYQTGNPPAIRQTKSTDSSGYYSTSIMQSSSFDQSTISRNSGSVRSSRSRDTRSLLTTGTPGASRRRMPPQPSPLEHDYDYLRESLIMFGDGIEQDSVGTRMSQQELLQRQRSDDEMIRRKERKYGTGRTKQRNRLANIPLSSSAASTGATEQQSGWKNDRQRSQSPKRRWNLIPSLSRSRSQSPARARSRGIPAAAAAAAAAASSSYVSSEPYPETYVESSANAPLLQKAYVDQAEADQERHRIDLTPLNPSSIAATNANDEAIREVQSHTIQSNGSRDYEDFENMQKRFTASDESPIMQPTLLEEEERPLRIDPFETVPRYQQFSPYDDDPFETRRINKIDQHRKELLRTANTSRSFDDGAGFQGDMDSQLRSRMLSHPKFHVPEESVAGKKAEILSDTDNSIRRASSDVGDIRSIHGRRNAHESRQLLSLESTNAGGRVRWAENWGTPQTKTSDFAKKSSPTSTMNFDDATGANTDEQMLYSVNSFPSSSPRAMTTRSTPTPKPKSILRKPRHTSVSSDDSCPSDETPPDVDELEGRSSERITDKQEPGYGRSNGLDFLDKNGRPVSPVVVKKEGTTQPMSNTRANQQTNGDTEFAKNIPAEYQRQFLRDENGDAANSGVVSNEYAGFIETVAAVVMQAAIRRFLAKLLVARIHPQSAKKKKGTSFSSKPLVDRQKISLQAVQKQHRRRPTLRQIRSNPATSHRLEEFAAVIIQSNFRGWWIRDSLTVDNYCAVLIQKTFRGYKRRIDYAYIVWQITTVQAVARSYIAQELATTRLYCILIIQSVFRGYRVRKQLKATPKATSQMKGNLIDRKREALARASGGDFSPSRSSKHISFRSFSKNNKAKPVSNSADQERKEAITGGSGDDHIRKKALATSLARQEIGRRRKAIEAEEEVAAQKAKEQKKREKISQTAQEARDKLKRMMAEDDVHSVSSTSSRNRFQRAPIQGQSTSTIKSSGDLNKASSSKGVTAQAARSVAFNLDIDPQQSNASSQGTSTNTVLAQEKTDGPDPIPNTTEEPPKRRSVLDFAKQFEAANSAERAFSRTAKPTNTAEAPKDAAVAVEQSTGESAGASETPVTVITNSTIASEEPPSDAHADSDQKKQKETRDDIVSDGDSVHDSSPSMNAESEKGNADATGPDPVKDPNTTSGHITDKPESVEPPARTPEQEKASEAASAAQSAATIDPDDGAAITKMKLHRLACPSFDEAPKTAKCSSLNADISKEEQARLDKMHEAFQKAGLMRRPGESFPTEASVRSTRTAESAAVDHSHAEAAGDLIKAWREKDTVAHQTPL